MKYLFMGSPPLAATILEAVSTQFGPPALTLTQQAKSAGRGNQLTPTAVETYARNAGLPFLAVADINAPEILAQLEALKPDVILVAAFGQIFREPLLQLPKLFCLNVHASLLPKYRGAAPIQWSIWNGEPEAGVSIQKMVRKLDAGDVLLQKAIPIEANDTSESLLKKLASLGGEALVESLRLIESEKYNFTPQTESLATFAPKIEREHAQIDWTKPADHIANQIRALRPWPVAETYLGKDRLKIFGAEINPILKGKSAGEIYTDSKSQLAVQCGDGRALSLTEIQLENRKRLDIKSFLMAFRGSFPFTKMETKGDA